MGRVIVVANQKGGVGKTTTSINLGACLAKMGKKVLLIDTDSQGNLATGLGISAPSGRTIYEVMIGRLPIEDVVMKTEWENLSVIPSDVNLAAAELELVSEIYRETILKRKLGGLRGQYDYVILDSPPSLGLLTINNFSASNSVIIPLQCEYYALEGLSKLLDTIKLVMDNINPDLTIDGVLMTMFDARTRLSKRMVEEVRKAMGSLVFETIIPRTIKLAEAPDVGKPIIYYMPYHKGAKAYCLLAEELVHRLGVSDGERVPELPKDFASHVMPGLPTDEEEAEGAEEEDVEAPGEAAVSSVDRAPETPWAPSPTPPPPSRPVEVPKPVKPAARPRPTRQTPTPRPQTPPPPHQPVDYDEEVEEARAEENGADAVTIEREEAELKALTVSLGQKLQETLGTPEPVVEQPPGGEGIEQELDKLMKEVDTLSSRIEQMKKVEAVDGGPTGGEAPIDHERARGEEFIEDLNVLVEQGYKVDGMMALLERDIKRFEIEYPAFIDRIARTEAARERFEALKLTDGDKVLKGTIGSLLADPNRVDEVERHLAHLEVGLAAASAEAVASPEAPVAEGASPAEADDDRQDRLDLWRSAGFETAVLEKIMATGDQAKIRKNFEVFGQRVERMLKMETVIDRIKAPALQEDIGRLRPLLKDVTKYNEAKGIFQGIVDRVKKK